MEEKIKALKDNKMKVEQENFIHDISSASTYVSDIQSIIFGGMSSRFWLLRKHFNSIRKDEMCELTLFSWECITLQLTHRDVDLVIKDEAMMKQFLKFVIANMRTLDGKKNSANGILYVLNK